MIPKPTYILNKELNEKEINGGKIVLQSKPRRLAVILTTKCNLWCIMCPLTDFRKTHNFEQTIPYESFKKIITLFPYLESIDWQGGEVFLVDYFKELFLIAASYSQIQHTIITNGLLIDDEWAKLLVQNNVKILFSIDSIIEETYEKIRKYARFKDLIYNINRLNEYRLKFNSKIFYELNAVIMRSNYNQIELFPDFCKKYGFSQLRFDYLRHNVAQEEDIFTNPDKEAISFIKTKLPLIELRCKELGIQFTHTLNAFLNKEINSKDEKPFIPKCKFPWRKLVIEETGNVRIECKCPHTVGNIIDNTIEEIWNGEMIKKYRLAMLKGEVQELCSKICLENAVEENFFEKI
jgi:MoaA/NifB/PqqE/SkfB family radical SAM enzyme